MNLFEKVTRKLKKQEHQPTEQILTKPEVVKDKVKYDFVQEYTLVDPKKLLIDHNCWGLCEKTPVAYENGLQGSGWYKCVDLNTSIMLPFLNMLKASPDTDTKSEAMRTISVVHVTDDIDIYILPVLPICKKEEKCWLYWLDNKQKTKGFPKGWFFHMTPDIRKAIAAQMKVYS